jgi:hypothetical protein
MGTLEDNGRIAHEPILWVIHSEPLFCLKLGKIMLARFHHNCEDQSEMVILEWWLFVCIMSQALKVYKNSELVGLMWLFGGSVAAEMYFTWCCDGNKDTIHYFAEWVHCLGCEFLLRVLVWFLPLPLVETEEDYILCILVYTFTFYVFPF